jgi:hypothetical protein
MAKRACLCGAVDCKRHRKGSGRNPRGHEHNQRRKVMLATTPEICARCGGGPRAADPWEAGHVVDLALGGGPEVQREHRSCNRRAGGLISGAKLRRGYAYA